MTSPSNSALHALLGRGNVPFYDFVARRPASWQLLISILAEARDKGAYSVPGMNERSASRLKIYATRVRSVHPLYSVLRLIDACHARTDVYCHLRSNYSQVKIVFTHVRVYASRNCEVARYEGNAARNVSHVITSNRKKLRSEFDINCMRIKIIINTLP